MRDINEQFVSELYVKHADALREIRAEQRARRATGMRVQLDDIEAEISYLLLREYRPGTVVEIGALHGWSTTWILSALRDNETGQLCSADLIDNAQRTVPAELAAGRWRFVLGDVRNNLGGLPSAIDYLFVDAAHTTRFAHWYLRHVLPTLAPGTPVSVHDVFHHARALPWTEGATVLGWLRRRGIEYFTASAAHAPRTHARLVGLRRELDLAEPVHSGKHNPMIFFSSC
ncbi:MAG TPA: class I SAM-dependent methyltransferase [Pseudonocardiaceae bacterium]|nr:class I SAM-dependent methyltransferase [Pseudonocardiaceae bacterium]